MQGPDVLAVYQSHAGGPQRRKMSWPGRMARMRGIHAWKDDHRHLPPANSLIDLR
jgi:hypothetical protein